MQPCDTIPLTALGQYVRDARLAAGLSQAALAELAGATQAQVSVLETRRDLTAIWPALLDRIGDALDLDRDQLYALANRIPSELLDALTGDVDALRRTRKELGL